MSVPIEGPGSDSKSQLVCPHAEAGFGQEWEAWGARGGVGSAISFPSSTCVSNTEKRVKTPRRKGHKQVCC